MQGVTFRAAREEDAPALARLHVAAWQWAYAGLMPDGYLAALNPAPREAMWRARLGSAAGRDRVAVAVDGGDLVGFAMWGPYRADEADNGPPPDGVGELQAIYLAQAYQGRGIGRALMARAVGHLAAQGYTEVRLWVLETNDLARRFYERQGFVADGARKIDDRDELALPEVRYGRPLP